MNPVTVHGPIEPAWCRWARHRYWARCAWIGRLEQRISRTDSGLAWLMRVKAI